MKHKNTIFQIFLGMLIGPVVFCLIGGLVVIVIGNNVKLPTAAPTLTATNTRTPTATFTPSETMTPSMTLTPSETFTPSMTLTSSETFTPTATPSYTPTLSKTDIAATAIVDKKSTTDSGYILASETAKSAFDDATIAAQNKRDTATAAAQSRQDTATAAAQARIDSQTSAAADRQSTIDARGVTATFVAAYKQITLGELVSYANKHIGEDVIIRGTVVTVVDDQTLQINVPPLNIIYVKLANTQHLSSIYQGDYVTVYGTVSGYLPGSDALGAGFREAELISASVTKP